MAEGVARVARIGGLSGGASRRTVAKMGGQLRRWGWGGVVEWWAR